MWPNQAFAPYLAKASDSAKATSDTSKGTSTDKSDSIPQHIKKSVYFFTIINRQVRLVSLHNLKDLSKNETTADQITQKSSHNSVMQALLSRQLLQVSFSSFLHQLLLLLQQQPLVFLQLIS